MGCHALFRVDCQALLDEVSSGQANVAPVFDGSERVVGLQDCLHFFKIGVAVERGVAAQEEVGDDAYGPYISDLNVSGLTLSRQGKECVQACITYTGFPCPVFLNISGAI